MDKKQLKDLAEELGKLQAQLVIKLGEIIDVLAHHVENNANTLQRLGTASEIELNQLGSRIQDAEERLTTLEEDKCQE